MRKNDHVCNFKFTFKFKLNSDLAFVIALGKFLKKTVSEGAF